MGVTKMKSLIKRKVVEDIKPVLRLLVKEIFVGNESIRIMVDLNAYIKSKSGIGLEVAIVENADNIRNVDNQMKQNFTWSTLSIKK